MLNLPSNAYNTFIIPHDIHGLVTVRSEWTKKSNQKKKRFKDILFPFTYGSLLLNIHRFKEIMEKIKDVILRHLTAQSGRILIEELH